MAGVPILIIDDEPGVLEGLREFLEDEGYEVHEAREGKRGLDLFRTVAPDLVMTDLRMPGISGVELIEEMKRLRSQVPIIIITGYGSISAAQDAIRLRAFDFITKPIDLESLKNSLDRARASVREAQAIEKEMLALKEQLRALQSQWECQLAKYAEAEPLIHTGRLLAGILHDLNNPLTFIMGQAELLQFMHPEVENVGVIKEQALRMKRIISTITKRMRQAKDRNQESLQLNALLEEEVYFLESHPYFKEEIEKEWHLDETLPLIRGVAAEFSQIFGNLIRNAAEAMKGRDLKRLILKTWHDESCIHVSVGDTGPGVAPHLKHRIFDAFFSTKTMESVTVGSLGMGIGLYHCRELVRRYGGEIKVENGQEMGAVFLVRLPKNRDPLT
ncbi:MAG: response regulator [Deltaproteobacteria bacterium]|nr:response regulator [Deltaproteobacteria bacterium]